MYKLIFSALCTLLILQVLSIEQVNASCCAGTQVGTGESGCIGTYAEDDYWKSWQCFSWDAFSPAQCDICIAHWTSGALGVFIGVPIAIVVLIIICCTVICCRRSRHHHHTTVVAGGNPYQPLPNHQVAYQAAPQYQQPQYQQQQYQQHGHHHHGQH
ncbi:hypothetical protein DFA_09985 [Cavenderia fasciculata]|uniref:Transmembrane protein n=1 Tax=Cavenderia fasciculata TaxID=261658 RepID=F4Q8Z0_CACFS|nr:uncharacterized protein DFA_09985 [Cavenderia fasciculata]EGG15159.1 hypothetical protein DFA_09985 [Cavenderia fasciculata]|eukprot:XP_004351879.1 hypothetical protein DFA_09985 [Cavenderia fasciculata]